MRRNITPEQTLGTNKKISILGCGWFGLELAKDLIAQGYTVKGSSTTNEKLSTLEQYGINPFLVNFQESEENFKAEFFDCDLLWICIPPKRRSSEQQTFLSKIERISAAAIKYKIKQVVFISSTSVYGDTNITVTEKTLPDPESDSGKAILAAESVLQNQLAFCTTIIRFGGLFGPGRDPGRFFSGKTAIPNGNAPVNLIHLSDCIGLSNKLLQTEAFGHIYNACSTEHPTKKEFYTLAAQKSGLILPSFINELLSFKLVNSENVPKYLNYVFTVSLF